MRDVEITGDVPTLTFRPANCFEDRRYFREGLIVSVQKSDAEQPVRLLIRKVDGPAEDGSFTLDVEEVT